MDLIIQLAVLGVVGIGCIILLKPTIKMKNKVIKGESFATLVYTDEKGGKLLVSEKWGLQGKPDYIFKKWGRNCYIPFEIKSTNLKEDMPHEGDMMQLVAYFLIIEEVYGKRPPYGRLIYKNKSFTIRNTYSIRSELKVTLEEMRRMLDGKFKPEIEPSFIKCKNCICQQTVCEWYGED